MKLTTFLNSRGFHCFEGFCQQNPRQVDDLISLSKNKIQAMEIGFNAGHSAEVFLENNPEMYLTSFDLGGHAYISTAKEYIDTTYPNRHTLILGESRNTIPEFIERQEHSNTTFDLIFIDGGHEYEVVKSDLENCSRLSNADTLVIIDDTVITDAYKAYWTDGPTKAWSEYLEQNRIVELGRTDYYHGSGMSWGKFLF